MLPQGIPELSQCGEQTFRTSGRLCMSLQAGNSRLLLCDAIFHFLDLVDRSVHVGLTKGPHIQNMSQDGALV